MWRRPGRAGCAAAAARGPVSMSARGLRLMAPGRPAPVLDGAALALAPGEHVALMGPSGIGKSSLIEAIARLRPARARY